MSASPPSSTFAKLLLVAASLAALGSEISWGEGPAAPPPDATAFRRVFVPADSPASWPTAGERYLPLSNLEFQNLVDAASDQSTSAIRLRGAAYRAELVDDAVLVGTVDYDIESPSEKSSIASLEPLNLAIESAAWQGENSPPVKWGRWSRAVQRDVWGVLVPRSGTLRMDWQLRAEPVDAQQLGFVLEIPPAVPQTLELLLPVEYQAVLPSATLVRTQADSQKSQRWLFQLASHGPHHLKLLRQTPQPQAARPQARVSQATVYRLESAGLQITTSFRIEPQRNSADELRCALPSDVHVKSVVVDRQPVEWRLDETSADGALVIQLPDSRRPRELEIEAFAPLHLDRPWRLPAIRPSHADWTEGTSLVVVSPRLEVQSFSAQMATLQHIVGVQPATASTEAYRLQEWSPDATLELIVARLEPRLSVESATAIDLRANETTARVAARISSELKATYQITAAIAPGWSIESVKTDPASALWEWHLEDNGKQKLVGLQLNRPIQPGEPLRVEFDARATRQGGRRGSLLPASVRALQVLSFHRATTKRELVLLRSQPRRQRELLHGLESVRVTPSDLTPGERELLPDPLVGELLDFSRSAAEQLVELGPSRSRYEVEVSAEVAVLPQATSHRFAVECRPQSGEISEIAVRFDQPLPASAEWMLSDDESTSRGRRLTPTLETNGADTASTYLVKLPFEATEAVRLAINYSVPGSESTAYNAISFPRAQRWGGQLILRGPLDGLHIEDAGWIPVGWPSKNEESLEAVPLVSCYRLEAGQSNRALPLTLRRASSGSQSAPVTAWLAEYQTHQSADGAAIYSAVYHLENSGANELELKLPPQTQLQATWLNGIQLEPRDLQAAAQTYRMRVSGAGRYPTLALQYVARGTALGRTTTVVPVLPECSFPIRLSRWTLWTPEQYVPDDLVTGYSAQRIPWRERLFGPLARGVGQQVFLPWRVEDWPRLWSTPVEGLRTRLLAERFGNRLDDKLVADSESTWGQLLRELTAELRAEEVVFLDTIALQSAGIGPLSQTAPANPAGVGAKGRQLASHSLAMVINPNRIVVTTNDRVAHWREQLQPTSAPRVFLVADEQLAQELESESKEIVGEIVSIEAWSRVSAASPPPWSGASPSVMSDVGQRACTISFLGTPPMVVVRRAYAHQAYWYVAWLASVVGGVWWLGQGRGGYVFAIAAASAACFVAPVYWLTLPQAILVGLLSAVVLRMVFAKAAPLAHERSTQAFLPRSAPVALLVCALMAVSETSGAPLAENLPRVLVPVDSAGNRQGDEVYLSESHREALEQTQGASDYAGAQYALSDIAVRGSLQTAAVETWDITLMIDNFVAQSEVELPLRQSEGDWLAEACSLDGKPVLLHWQADGNGCRVELQGVGAHELKLTVKPKITKSGPQSRLQLHLPRLPGCRLELTTSERIGDIKILGAGRIVRDSNGVRSTLVGLTQPLRVDWTASSSDILQQAGDVEQLAWLRVEPFVAHLAVQLQFHELAQPPRILDVEVPAELKLLPPAANSLIERIETLADGATRLHMKRGWETNARVPLEFQLQRTSSWGRFFFPALHLRGYTRERSLFAVSIGAGLSSHENLSESLRSISAAEFAAAWGEVERPPQFAYSTSTAAAEWSLQVWPEPPTFVAEQSVAMHCEPDRVKVDFQAAVSQLTGKWLVHQLRTPAELEIDEITIVDQASGEALPMRWSQPQGSSVTILLGQPVTRPHVVRLQGTLRPATDGAVVVPQIVLTGAERSEVGLSVWRSPRVLALWADPAAAPPELARPTVAPNSREILVGSYAVANDKRARAYMLQLQANEPRFKADTVARIDEAQVGRTLSMRTRISVVAGVVGQLQVFVPINLAGPYELRPAAVGTVGNVESTTEGHRVTLLLRHPVTAGKSVELQLSGRLTTTAEGPLEVPDVTLIGADGNRRYVMLPTRFAGRPIEWQIAGLKREPLPENLKHFAPDTAHELPYRIIGSRFTAREPIYRGPLRSAALRDARVAGVLDAQGNFSATVSFILQPGRATHCSLRLPAEARLLQIVSDGQPASRQQLPDGSWRVALGPPFLPRVLEVAYLAELNNSSARVRLAPPQVLIGDAVLPYPSTSWQVSLADGLRIREATWGRKIAGARFAESRYRELASALEEAAALALDSPESEVRPWFAAWREQVEAAGREATRWGVESTVLDFQPALESTTSWSQLVQKMSETEVDSMMSPSLYPPSLPQRPTASLDDGTDYLISDSAGQIEIVRAPLTVGNVGRWIAAGIILALGIALERPLQSAPGWIENLGRRRHALVLGAGLVWWCLFSPSFLGLVMIVLATLSLAVEYARQRRGRRSLNVSTQLTPRVS